MSDMPEEEAAELAYGLLWHTTNDTYTPIGRLTSTARITLGNAIGMERKGRGIQAAKEWMKAHPQEVRCQGRVWTWREMMDEWPEDD